MTSDSKSIAIVAVGAALAGAAVGATIVARAKSGAASSKKVAASPSSSSSSSASPFPLLPAAALSCVVFISDGGGGAEGDDGGDTSSHGFNVKVARKSSFFELLDAVVGASAGRLDGRSRLFVSVEGAYQEMTPDTARALLASAAASDGGGGKAAARRLKPGEGDSLVVLAATRDGADLSAEAASRPPPTPVPRGPRALPFVGNALALVGPHEVPGMNLYRNLFDPKTVRGRWGDTIRISLPLPSAAAAALEAEAGVVDEARSATETIVTSDPEILAELVAREADFPKMWNRPAQLALQDFTGNGIFTSSSTSSDWIAAHGLLPRSFNAIKLDAMYPSVLDACRGFVRSLRSKVEEAGGGRARVDHFSDFLTALTADAVVKCAIGLDMRNVARLSRGEPPHAFIPAFRFGLKYSSGGANASADLPASVRFNPLVSNARALAERYEDAKRTCTEIIDDMIERTRLGELSGCGTDGGAGGGSNTASGTSSSSPSGGGSTSVLATMLNDRAPNGKLIRLGAIQGHVLNLMIAGHETTAATLGFVVYYLSRHPEWEARVVEEARAVLAGRTEPAAADLRKLVVTEAVFREALRLHPPVVVLTRDASADTTLARGKYVVRRGQRVMCLLPALHRRDDVWGSGAGYPDPEVFDPSRFVPGDARAEGRPPTAFSPWGFGQRACIGSQFALMEAKCLLCLLYSQLCVGTPEGFVAVPSTVEGGAAPAPKGLSVLLYPRAGAPDVAAAEGAPAAAAAAASAAPAASPAAPSAAASPPPAARSIPIRILYGSNGGTCESFASSLAQRAAQLGFSATAEPLDAAADGSLAVAPASSASSGEASERGAAVAIVTATYNGMPPDNAAKFMKWLSSLDARKEGGSESGGGGEKAAAPLSSLRYAVFGVGNSQWNLTYLKVAKAIDVGLAAAGAQRVRAFEGADVDGAGAADAFEDWASALLEGAQAAAGVEGGAAASSGAKKPSPGPPPRVKLDMLPEGTPALSSAAEVVRQARKAGGIDAPELAGEGYHPLRVTAATQLLAASSASAPPAPAAPSSSAASASAPPPPPPPPPQQQQQRATVNLEVELPPGLAYQAGDHFELIPRNAAPLVDAALELVGLGGGEPVAWTPVNVAGATGGPARGIVAAGRAAAAGGGDSAAAAVEGAIRQQPVTARAALEYLADLSAPCSRRLVAALAAATRCPPEAEALKALASEDGYAARVALPRLSLIDLLSRFKSVDARAALGASSAGDGEGGEENKPLLEAFVNAHPRLVPRYYSISSSPKVKENRATITVGLVQLITKSGRQHRGPGSGLAHDARVGDEVVGTVRRLQSTFRYPSDRPETPVVMVGPGTGVAPMIGFLEEREALLRAGKKLGKAVLFFGCRGRADFIFRERLEAWVASGVLTKLHVAMSREEDEQGRRGYVQDWIAKEAVDLWPLLERENGIVYVCGDARSMAPEVRRSFAGVAASAGGRSQAAAEAFVGAMLEGNRYLEDVWAG